MRKPLSLCFIFLISMIWGCGSDQTVFFLPPPDVEGVDEQYAVVCQQVEDADAGTQISVLSPTGMEQAPLDINGAFSITVCWRVGDIATFQYLDDDDNPLTTLQSQTREDLNGPDLCPEPSNEPPVCL